MTLRSGSRLGPYEILAALGAGGMGEVYRARDPRLGRDVAIKVLPASFSADADRLRRFEQEAKAAGILNHPNLTAVYDVGAHDGAPYVVQELLEGETLRAALAGGRLPQRRAVEYGSQIAHGLSAAHERGIVHRDLKPENVFVTNDGRVKILDFGLAKLTREEATGQTTNLPTESPGTEPGVVMGTLGYMSPEQVRGKPADARSDIFAFGAILYEMLSGRRAFHGDTAADTMSAILKEDPADLSITSQSISPALERIVRHCLEKSPERRLHSAHDLAFELESLSTTSAEGVRPLEGAGTRRRVLRLLGAALAATVLIGLGFLAGRRFRAEEPARTARTFLKVTDLPGTEAFPSLSPKGDLLAFVHNPTAENADIYVQRVGGQNPILLTKDSPKDDYTPAFSPDGNTIAFRSDRDGGGIYLMGSTGESVRRLTDFGFQPAWTPDGRALVVSTDFTFTPYGRGAGTGELWSIDVASGRKTKLFGGDAVQPSVSPHGLRIAYFGLLPGSAQRDIWTIPADGLRKGESPFAATNDTPIDWNPFWSADGEALYFLSDREGTMNLWRVPIDEKSGKPLGAPVPAALPAREVAMAAISADGRHIAYRAVEDSFSIERGVLDPPGRESDTIPVVRDDQDFTGPAASPDGGLLAYSTFGSREDLVLVAADGTGRRKLTDDAARDRNPYFSPDGRTIYFQSDRSGRWEIWSIAPDGSGLTQLSRTSGEPPTIPLCSPDGRQMAVNVGTEVRFLAIGDKSSRLSDPIPRPPDGFDFAAVAWSPDGSRLAGELTGSSGTPAGISIYFLAEKRYERLASTGLSPQFFPDGRRLLYWDRDGIKILDLAARSSRVVLPTTPARPTFNGVLSRDGKVYFTTRRTAQSDIWLMSFR